MGQGQPGLRHPDHRDAGRGRHFFLADNGRGAPAEGVGHKAVAVGARPLERHKDFAGLDLSGVIGHPGDDESFVTLEAVALQTG